MSQTLTDKSNDKALLLLAGTSLVMWIVAAIFAWQSAKMGYAAVTAGGPTADLPGKVLATMFFGSLASILWAAAPDPSETSQT